MNIRFLIVVLAFLAVQTSFAGNSLPEIAQRCQLLSAQSDTVYYSDFKWGFSLAEMLEKFTDIYGSNKRLAERAYWDNEDNVLKLPYSKSRGGDIPITETFIQSITRHIEEAFKLSFIDAVFFPDMGHSHMLIPNELMEKKYRHYPIDSISKMYEEAFKDPKVKLLYHTAEQLKTLDANGQVIDDTYLIWRHQTRNIIGSITPDSTLEVRTNSESQANTVHNVPGYFWWSAGFNISANKDGCFEYRHNGKSYYYDISMFDLLPDDSYENYLE